MIAFLYTGFSKKIASNGLKIKMFPSIYISYYRTYYFKDPLIQKEKIRIYSIIPRKIKDHNYLLIIN